MQKAHPDVPIFLAAIDDHLNEHGYIVPVWATPETVNLGRDDIFFKGMETQTTGGILQRTITAQVFLD